MRYKVTRGAFVRFDVAAILDFVGNYAGYDIGRKKVAEISRTVARLSEYPHVGTRHEDVSPGLRVIPAGDKAVICFTVDDELRIVRIVCVSYAGQDWQAIAKSRQDQS